VSESQNAFNHTHTSRTTLPFAGMTISLLQQEWLVIPNQAREPYKDL
jgi:hypothetical protein